MEDLKTYILENDDIKIKTLIEFKVGCLLIETGAKEPTSSYSDYAKITDTNKNQLVSMLGSGCEQLSSRYKKNSIDSELFLGILPTVANR